MRRKLGGAASAVIAAALILTGIIVTVGGNGEADPLSVTGTFVSWTSLDEKPPYRTVEAAGGLIDNKFYRFGGFQPETGFHAPTASASVYDISETSWSSLPDVPFGITHAARVIDGSRFILAGAVAKKGNAPEEFAVADVLTFDTKTKAWGALPPLPAPRGSGAAALVGRDLHFIGGVNPDRVPQTDHWVLDLDDVQAGWQPAPAFPVSRSHFAAIAVGSDIYAFGGMTGWEQQTVEQADGYRYDAKARTWTRFADMPKPLSHMGEGTIEVDGRIWVFGGEPKYPDSSSEIFVYDIQQNAWQIAEGQLPDPRFAGLAARSGNTVYYFDGSVYADTAWKGILPIR